MTTRLLVLTLIGSIIVGGLRIGGVTHTIYQAFAHLYVGLLFGMAFQRDLRSLALSQAITLTAIETIMFLYNIGLLKQ